MHWWKGGQHSCGNSNQVCPVWYLPPGWQKWLKGKDYGPQTPLRCWTNQHRNPPRMADWKRQAASELGHSYRGHDIELSTLAGDISTSKYPSEQWIACLEMHEHIPFCLYFVCVVSCVPFVHISCSVIFTNSVFITIQTLHISTICCAVCYWY